MAAIDFKKIVDDFKATNWQDPGTWTAIPKAVVLIAIIVALPVAGYFGLWQGQLEGLGRGLQFELFKPAAQETVRDFYAELPITVRVMGVYHDMGAFASDVGQLSRIVTLNDVDIEAGKDGN